MPRKAKTKQTEVEAVKKVEKVEAPVAPVIHLKKEELTEATSDEKADFLVSLEEYVKSGIHLGTKVITTQMRGYVFKRRSDGLAVFNTNVIDKKIRAAASLLSKYAPEDIIIAGKREAGWPALTSFNKATGIKVFTKKYPAGIITNTRLPEFFEPKLVFVVDPWLDKNPMKDSLQINVPIISLCDTNNIFSNADLIIPCNNKSNKSIGLIFWILAKEYNKIRGITKEIPSLEEFTGNVQ